MQAHPVPQNIMQVEFQLVGILTLRQFAYLAAAGIVGWLIFILPVMLFIKLPFVLMVVGFGLALAFLPINDMKLERWIIAFFKAIYAPTKRVWFKETKIVDFLGDYLETYLAHPAVVHTPRGTNRAKLDLYLQNRRKEIHNNLDQLEDRRIQSLDFQTEAPAELTAPPSLAPENLVVTAKIETARVVTESKREINKIASKVIFTPIATIKLPDKNLFVKPVSNVRSHSLNPKTAGSGTVVLPIRGETLFQVSDELKQKLSKYVTPEHKTVGTSQLAEERPHLPTPLGRFVPIADEKTAPPPAPIVVMTPPPPPVAVKPVEKPPLPETIAAAPAPVIPPPVPLQPIIINVTQPSPPPVAPPPTQNPDQNDRMATEIQKLTDEESMLKGELDQYKDQEAFLRRQLAEKKEFPTTTPDNFSRQDELEAQLKKMEAEKIEAQDRAQKLESLITQLSNQRQTPLNREIITPQAAEFAKPTAPHTVAPRRAEGKMAPPMTTVPNVINGLVKDASGLFLPDTIIVVKDKDDEPVRALKTNKIGQFAISTALPNGTYLMEVEKEGYEFDLVEIQLNGAILPPIEIRSRGA